jgi:DNA helicase-2/ATP-dependent DNA helicase PcrA
MAFPNAAQGLCIEQVVGASLIIAPAGTGKTRVLAERVLRAVAKEIASPKNILCLTFTNRAAQEMRKVLMSQQRDWAKDVTIRTFHSLCTHMLRQEAGQIGLSHDFVVYDDDDCLELIGSIFELNKLSVKQSEKNRIAREIFGAICDAKIGAQTTELSTYLPSVHVAEKIFAQFPAVRIVPACRYQQELADRNALDFGDLVYLTRTMLDNDAEIKARWSNRFHFIQVDEVQDTHTSEYEIVKALAKGSGNIAFIGDLAQTIYGWRGSNPELVLKRFREDFKPIEHSLTENYRATRTLLKAANSFAISCGGFGGRYKTIVPSETCEQGQPICIAVANSEEDEARWIGQQILNLKLEHDRALRSPGTQAEPFCFHKIAILTRTNSRNQVIFEELNESFNDHFSCVTVEQLEFFQRKEIKDALAYLRLLVNPRDAGALQRIPINRVGDATRTNMAEKLKTCGLLLTDLTAPCVIEGRDPFAALLSSYDAGDVVVFDVETTGLSPTEDDIIEIAAQRLVCGKSVQTFHRYLKGSKVGDSIQIHHISDEMIEAEGVSAAQALHEFFDFVGPTPVVGHNVGFDVKMVKAHARKCGIEPPPLIDFDTFDIARRFVEAPDNKLTTLREFFGLPTQPTHRAADDVATTVELLARLVPLVRAESSTRTELIARCQPVFLPLATKMQCWRKAMNHMRPYELLEHIACEEQLPRTEPSDKRAAQRKANVTELIARFKEQDDETSTSHPETALRTLLDYTALAKNIDQIAEKHDKVMITTIFQAKGLEFDYVFIAGAVEDEMPSYRNKDAERLKEEQRLFYVALTRAKQRLFISGYKENSYGYRKPTSRFVRQIDANYVTPG